MITPPSFDKLNEYQKGYIGLVDAQDLTEALRQNRSDIEQFLNMLKPEDYNYRYAAEKWSVAQVIGHIIDSERIFSYRVLRISRGDTTPLPGYDENFFAMNDTSPLRTPDVLIKEYFTVRAATMQLFLWLTDEMWDREGTANQNIYTARIIGWMLAGHERHHLNILQERYIRA